MSMTIWVTLPVITVVGDMWENSIRAAAFCTPMAMTPIMPVRIAVGWSPLVKGASSRPAAMKAISSMAWPNRT
jgi:hypothetical protein